MTGDLHILPIDDLKEHTESFECECKPLIELHGTTKNIIHNAYDNREYEENGFLLQTNLLER